MRHKAVDHLFVGIVGLLVVMGVFVFSSAALGLLARMNEPVTSIVANHLLLGLCLGAFVAFVVSRVPYKVWRPYAPHLYIASLILTALVFVPGVGFSAGGATRWIHIGPLSMQPSEALKVGTVFMMAFVLARYQAHITDVRYGLGMFLAVLTPVAIVMLLQPDTGTFGVIAIAAAAMYFAAGATWRDVGILFLGGLLLLGTLALTRDYVRDRFMTFFDPSHDPLGSSYQLQQSLVAIGSGGLFGRGFGQSQQKFEYLPEPITDSIFAVMAEEFGFVGSLVVLSLFMAFAARGFWIAARTPDLFGALLVVGIVTYITAQSFFNIAAMVGIIPLTGIPLVFMSHGGTALLIALGAIGIVLNVSRYRKELA
jgi:cell division protein FtsW